MRTLSEGLELQTILVAKEDYRLAYDNIDGGHAIILYHKNKDTNKWGDAKIIGYIKFEGLSNTFVVSNAVPKYCAIHAIKKLDEDYNDDNDEEY